jgi:hypothetical protein
MKLSSLAISLFTASAALAQSPGPAGWQPEPLTFIRAVGVLFGAVLMMTLLAFVAFGAGGKRWERP